MDDKPLDLGLLKAFSPLDGLKPENLHALAKKTSLRELQQGRVLFKEGDSDKRTYFVVAGSVEIFDQDGVLATIRGGTPGARNALAPTLPSALRCAACRASTYSTGSWRLLRTCATFARAAEGRPARRFSAPRTCAR